MRPRTKRWRLLESRMRLGDPTLDEEGWRYSNSDRRMHRIDDGAPFKPQTAFCGEYLGHDSPTATQFFKYAADNELVFYAKFTVCPLCAKGQHRWETR